MRVEDVEMVLWRGTLDTLDVAVEGHVECSVTSCKGVHQCIILEY